MSIAACAGNTDDGNKDDQVKIVMDKDGNLVQADPGKDDGANKDNDRKDTVKANGCMLQSLSPQCACW